MEAIPEEDLGIMAEEDLVDAYIVSAELSDSADDFRKEVKSELMDRMDGDKASGKLGTVTRVTRSNWRVGDEEEVLGVLAREGVNPEHVKEVDSKKVERQVENIDSIEKKDILQDGSYSYLQKTGVDQEEKETLIEHCKQADDPELRQACLTELGID